MKEGFFYKKMSGGFCKATEKVAVFNELAILTRWP